MSASPSGSRPEALASIFCRKAAFIEVIQQYAAKVAAYSTVATILVLRGGGLHYLSTTKNLTQPGSLAILGWVRYTILAMLPSLAFFLVVELYRYSRGRRSAKESRSITEIRGERPK